MRVQTAVVLVFLAAPGHAQESHWIDPNQTDTFSLCVREDCLETAWPVANLIVTTSGSYRVWTRTEIACRRKSTGRDVMMARGYGWERILLNTQLYASHFSWCTVSVANLGDERQQYRVSAGALPEMSGTQLWLSQKRSLDSPSVRGRDDNDLDERDPNDPEARFDDAFWRQLVYNQHQEPDSIAGRGSWVLSEPVNMHIVTTNESGEVVLVPDVVARMRRQALAVGRLLSGRNIIRRVDASPENPGERLGWILVTPTADADDVVCGKAGIGWTAGRIWLRSTRAHCMDADIFAHELGHALGFYHLDPSSYGGSVMVKSGSAPDTFTARESYHARLAYEAGRRAPYCGWPQGENCQTRGTLGFRRPPLVHPPVAID